MKEEKITLVPGKVTLAQWKAIYRGATPALDARFGLLRNVLPIKGLARRKQSRTRATLTIGGKPIERD